MAVSMISFVAIFSTILVVSSVHSTRMMRGCYYWSRAQYRRGLGDFGPENYEMGLCSHLYFAYAQIYYRMELLRWYEANDAQVYSQLAAFKQNQTDLQLVLSVGGPVSRVVYNLYSTMVANATHRATVINSTIPILREFKFDGVEFDWQHPNTTENKANWVLFIKDLREALEREAEATGNKRIIITAAVPADRATVEAGYDIPNLAKYVDFFNVMTYNYHVGTKDTTTGFNSPLYELNGDGLGIDATMRYYHDEMGVPKSKLVIGLATYGQGWTLADPTVNGVGAPASGYSPQQKYSLTNGTAAYFEICQLIRNNNYTEHYDTTQQAIYATGDNNVWIGYDNVTSFDAKLDWIVQNEYAGAFVWSLDLDDYRGLCSNTTYPLLKRMKMKLEAPEPVTTTPAPVTPSPPSQPPSCQHPPHWPHFPHGPYGPHGPRGSSSDESQGGWGGWKDQDGRDKSDSDESKWGKGGYWKGRGGRGKGDSDESPQWGKGPKRGPGFGFRKGARGAL